MAIVVFEYKLDPEDNNEIRYLGTKETYDAAINVVANRYDEVWTEDINENGGIMHFSYDMRFNDTAASTLGSLWEGANPQWLGKAVGYVEYDNDWARHMWFMFDESLPAKIRL